MKKIITWLLLCLLSIWLIGCGDTPLETPTPEAPETPVSSFEYQENEDGGMTVTRFIGNETTVVIPKAINGKNVTRIGEHAFHHQTGLLSVKIPSHVQELCTSAFTGCQSLIQVSLPDGLFKIGAAAFRECDALATIELPNSLETVGNHAFDKCTSLKSITIPKSLKTLGSHAFSGAGLETVVFEQGCSLEVIDICAFYGTKIQEISLPTSIKTISFAAFEACDRLERVSLNNGLEIIQNSAFSRTPIKEIIIPTTVTDMTEMTFEYCLSLEAVKFEGNAPTAYVYVNPQLPMEPECAAYTVYYHQDAIGFTSPTWNGYTSQIW